MAYDVAPAAFNVAQPYGCTTYALEVPDPDCPGLHKHLGIDLDAGEGDATGLPVFATRAGVVYALGSDTYLEGHDLGPNAVCLQFDDGGWCWYGHLLSTPLRDGQRVSVGDPVGLIGDYGVSTGPHLHFEVRMEDPEPQDAAQAVLGAVDPTPWLMFAPAPAAAEVMPAELPSAPVLVNPST